MPWETIAYCSRKWALLAVKPSTCMGAGRDIDSTPPPTTMSWKPDKMPIAAKFTACWPEPQKRLRVTPGASSDQPASSAAMRAMSIAWSPLPAPQPITTSSTSAVSKPLRDCSALSTCAKMRCGCTLCSEPVSLPLPRGERTASMIQASRSMWFSFQGSKRSSCSPTLEHRVRRRPIGLAVHAELNVDVDHQ